MAKILVVDDDPAQRARLKHTLEAAGYAVATAPDAIQGLVAITRDPPDLILSDILMPRMDGFTFIREVKSRPDFRVIPFLFVTSTLVSDDDRQFAQMLGAEAILARSDDANAALGIVESCLKRHTRSPRRHADEWSDWQLPAPAHPLVAEPVQPAPSPRLEEQVIEALPAKSLEPAEPEPPPVEEQREFLQQYGEQKTVQLEAKIVELEQANLTLEQRAQELAAVAAERDQLVQQVQAHALELEARVAERTETIQNLAEISRLINATLNPEPLLDEIVERGAALIHAAECTLFLYNPDADTYHGAASSAMARDMIRQLYFSAGTATAAQKIVEQRAAAAICNLDRNAHAVWSLLPRRAVPVGLEGDVALIVPLTIHEQVHGLLVCADRSTERIFSAEEIEVITQLADQSALALENARLLYESSRRLEELRLAEELRAATLTQVAVERDQLIRRATAHSRDLEQRIHERRRHLSALANISKTINATLSPEAVLDQIVQSACALVHMDTCNLFLFNPETNTFHGASSSTMPRDSIRKLYFSANNGSPLQAIVQDHAAVALTEDGRERSVHNFPMLEETFHAKAALITPIVARNQVLGIILSIAENPQRVFKPEEIELLTIFADQAASALENARLFYEATRALDELSAAQQQLAEAEKLAAAVELAGAAAHELSQPLTVILTQMRRMKPSIASPDIQKELVLIETQTQRMVEIVDQLRRITRYETKPYVGSTQILDLPRSARSASPPPT
ncbi:MAG: GAF domain-containing protein [Chloroflexi bacterium]|nr:GAF domain-containing protein [Chloroflexota bacterium]